MVEGSSPPARALLAGGSTGSAKAAPKWGACSSLAITDGMSLDQRDSIGPLPGIK